LLLGVSNIRSELSMSIIVSAWLSSKEEAKNKPAG